MKIQNLKFNIQLRRFGRSSDQSVGEFNIKKSAKGFSLVEMVVYIALLALLVIAVVKSLVFMTSSYADIRVTKSIVSSAETLLNRFTYEVKRATTLSGAFGTTTGSLTLNQGATTTIFSLDSSLRAVISVNGTTAYLTGSEVKVTNFTFNQLQATTTSKGVTLQLTLTNSSGRTVKSENFEATSLTRN